VEKQKVKDVRQKTQQVQQNKRTTNHQSFSNNNNTYLIFELSLSCVPVKKQ